MSRAHHKGKISQGSSPPLQDGEQDFDVCGVSWIQARRQMREHLSVRPRDDEHQYEPGKEMVGATTISSASPCLRLGKPDKEEAKSMLLRTQCARELAVARASRKNGSCSCNRADTATPTGQPVFPGEKESLNAMTFLIGFPCAGLITSCTAAFPFFLSKGKHVF